MEVIAFVIIAGILGWIGYSAFNKEKNGKHPLDNLVNNRQPSPAPEAKPEVSAQEVKPEPVVVAEPVVVPSITEPVAEVPKAKRGRKKAETTAAVKEKPAKKAATKTKKAATTAKKVKKV